MSSRRSVRQLLVAVLLGVLVGGGLMAVTPAGAEVNKAVATNWKKIWKKNLKPLADKRYSTKKASDAKYQPKGNYEAAGSGYSKAESDAKYAGAGSAYSKAESDAKYAPNPKTLRGVFTAREYATAADQFASATVSWGHTLASAPTPVYVIIGGSNVNCPGTAANPQANPGYACFYEMGTTNVTTDRDFFNPWLVGASPYGTDLRIQSAGAGQSGVWGRWAVTPNAPIVATRVGPGAGGERQGGATSAGH